MPTFNNFLSKQNVKKYFEPFSSFFLIFVIQMGVCELCAGLLLFICTPGSLVAFCENGFQ